MSHERTEGMRESGGKITEPVDTKSKKRRFGLLQQNEQPLPGSLDDVTLHEITTKPSWTALDILPSVSNRLLQQSEQLLPGIPDDVTLHEIATKLPWTALQILASVSNRWGQAIHSREVYDARVRCHSTETLVLLESSRPDDNSHCLYSMIDRSSLELPPLPYLVDGTARSLRHISLDGKMYFLGGDSTLEDNEDLWGDMNGKDVFVLDLAGSMAWKQCASMLEPRALFDCGVVDGKIYVFGGEYHGKPVGGSEVYDAQRNVWSSIQPMKHMRADHHVVTLGHELLVYGGAACKTRDLEVYNTVQNEWRLIERFGKHHKYERLFTAQGKLHKFTKLGIYVHDTDSNSWRQRHSNLFPTLGPVDSIKILPYQIVVENDQLLVGFAACERRIDGRDFPPELFQSRGFGSEIKEIVWEKVVSFLEVRESRCSILEVGDSMCSIQL